MKVTFLGTGVAVPLAKKAQSSLLIEDDKLILVDCGFGCMLRLEEAGYTPADLDGILLTHFHTDHCGELIGILKARWLERDEKIEIFAPFAKENLEAIFESYPYLRTKVKVVVKDKPKFGSMKFEVREGKHAIINYAYKIENLLISGDTRSFPELYEDVEMVIHEMSLSFGYPAIDHTTPENFVENARVKKAYFVHMYPEAYENRSKIKEFVEKRGIDVNFPNDLESIEI